MRAIVCRELSGIGGLEFADIPPPEPGPGEVRIRVRACGLNFADSLMIKGQYQDRPALPFVPGFEVAGRIDACGPGVADFAASGSWRRSAMAASPRWRSLGPMAS
jgi:NADPH:quinone reductase